MKSYDLSNLTVLIVEKFATMRTIFRQVMREFSIPHIHDAGDPEEGYVQFNDFSPDIVFIDWAPGFDGLNLVQAIRKGKNTPDPFAAIIMVSAYTETHQIKEARDAGVTEYLAKPISANRIYDRIVAVIENDRQFVRVEAFVGPDRRRLGRPYGGEERRAENLAYDVKKPRTKTQESDEASKEKKDKSKDAD
ncbi:MAG: response regulator [Proteobacteria bacterium]|nr:response regulator [Pseudomonadota bacterium]